MTAECPEIGKSALVSVAVRASEEVAYLCRLSLAVQEGLAQCRFSRLPDAAALERLQGIDRITQGLADLLVLMANMSRQLHSGTVPDQDSLLKGVLLYDLANRSPADSASEQPASDSEHRAESGEISWL